MNKLGIVKCILVLLVLVAPIAYAQVGGGFGINVEVVSNNDTDDDTEEETDISIYFHSNIEAFDSEREENYAFTGEEVHFEVYVQNDDEVEDVILELDDEEIDCRKRNSRLDDGDDLDGFSEEVEYQEDIMDYYECEFMVAKDHKGEIDIEIQALDDDEDILEEEEEEWEFNPSLSVEVGESLNKLEIRNKEDISVDVDTCGDNKNLDADDRLTVSGCIDIILRII